MNFRSFCYILIFGLSFVSLKGVGQEIKSFHVDSTGRLYVNPGTPVYLFISTSPDAKDAVRLRSIDPESEPMYWDGHGFHYLTHQNIYLGRNIRFDLFADGMPPQTSANFDPKMGIQKNNVIYLSGSATLELTAIDPFSGVHSTYYSVNGNDFQQYNKPISFNKDGKYTIQFYSLDNVGNKEDECERVIIVDTTPPITSLEIEGPQHSEVVAAQSRFKLTATDEFGLRETFYSINNGQDIKYNRLVGIANLSEGEHTIYFYSIDLVGNIEEKQSFTFFVDKTPPMVFEEIIGNTYMVAGREYSSGRSQLRIVAVDNKAGVKEIHYSINKEPFKLYEKPIFLSEITGALTIRSYAIDNVGNKGTSDAEGQQFSMPEVDITGPNIKHNFTGSQIVLRDTLWISPRTKVNILASDRGSGVNRIEYKVNDNPVETFNESFTVSQAGYHKVNCTAWDNVENLNIAAFNFGVDANPPEIFYNFSVKSYKNEVDGDETIAVFSPGVQLYIGATDDIVGVDRIIFSINDARERAYTQLLSGFRTSQTHTVLIRAIDKLGNEKQETIRFRVE